MVSKPSNNLTTVDLHKGGQLPALEQRKLLLAHLENEFCLGKLRKKIICV